MLIIRYCCYLWITLWINLWISKVINMWIMWITYMNSCSYVHIFIQVLHPKCHSWISELHNYTLFLHNHTSISCSWYPAYSQFYPFTDKYYIHLLPIPCNAVFKHLPGIFIYRNIQIYKHNAKYVFNHKFTTM